VYATFVNNCTHTATSCTRYHLHVRLLCLLLMQVIVLFPVSLATPQPAANSQCDIDYCVQQRI